MDKVFKLDKPVRKYEDKNGRIVLPGDILKFSDGSLEKVYLAVGDESMYDLGVNASNEAFLKAHPCWTREVYPLSQFRRSEYEVVGHEDQ